VIERTDFVITTSVDGHLKLWKKQESGIEFVKHYRAHLAPIVGVAASSDGQLFASIAEDGSAKVFDVVNFGTFSPNLLQIYYNKNIYHRHDYYAQARLYTTRLLLGTSKRAGSVFACDVRCSSYCNTLHWELIRFHRAAPTRTLAPSTYMMGEGMVLLWKHLPKYIVRPFISWRYVCTLVLHFRLFR
jgi:WD40 repeat protein